MHPLKVLHEALRPHPKISGQSQIRCGKRVGDTSIDYNSSLYHHNSITETVTFHNIKVIISCS